MGLSHLAELAQFQVTGQNIMNSESKHGQKADVVIGTINSYQTALSLTTHPLYAVSAQPAPMQMLLSYLAAVRPVLRKSTTEPLAPWFLGMSC